MQRRQDRHRTYTAAVGRTQRQLDVVWGWKRVKSLAKFIGQLAAIEIDRNPLHDDYMNAIGAALPSVSLLEAPIIQTPGTSDI